MIDLYYFFEDDIFYQITIFFNICEEFICYESQNYLNFIIGSNNTQYIWTWNQSNDVIQV